MTLFSVLEDPVIQALAAKNDISPAQVCLSWVLSKGAALVTKSQNEMRMKGNLEAQNITMSKEDLEKIDALNANKQRLYLNPYSVP